MTLVISAQKARASEDRVSEQVAIDLAELLNSSSDPKKLLKNLANKINVHEKTLTRILNQENRPSYITVFKIYRYLLSEFDDSKVIERAPDIIKQYLLNANPQKVEKGTEYFSSIDKEIQKNPVFAEIYSLGLTGPFKKVDIAYRFGKYGIEVLDLMVSKNVIVETRPGEFSIGPNQTNFTPESILSLGLQLTQTYGKPMNGYEMSLHFMGFYAEGLSEEAYIQWQKIDQEAYFKKVNLSKNPNSLGKKRAFTFMITETLDAKDTK